MSTGSPQDSGNDTFAPESAVTTTGKPTAISLVSDHETFAGRRSARIDFICNVSLAVTALGIAVLFLWARSERHPFPPRIESTAPLAEVTPARPAEPEGTPVRIANAFDATEVFEFPYGTSESEAHEAVVELLLGRARQRGTEGQTLRRVSSLHRDRDAQMPQAEIFVTRLLARTRDLVNETNDTPKIRLEN